MLSPSSLIVTRLGGVPGRARAGPVGLAGGLVVAGALVCGALVAGGGGQLAAGGAVSSGVWPWSIAASPTTTATAPITAATSAPVTSGAGPRRPRRRLCWRGTCTGRLPAASSGGQWTATSGGT